MSSSSYRWAQIRTTESSKIRPGQWWSQVSELGWLQPQVLDAVQCHQTKDKPGLRTRKGLQTCPSLLLGLLPQRPLPPPTKLPPQGLAHKSVSLISLFYGDNVAQKLIPSKETEYNFKTYPDWGLLVLFLTEKRGRWTAPLLRWRWPGCFCFNILLTWWKADPAHHPGHSGPGHLRGGPGMQTWHPPPSWLEWRHLHSLKTTRPKGWAWRPTGSWSSTCLYKRESIMWPMTLELRWVLLCFPELKLWRDTDEQSKTDSLEMISKDFLKEMCFASLYRDAN